MSFAHQLMNHGGNYSAHESLYKLRKIPRLHMELSYIPFGLQNFILLKHVGLYRYDHNAKCNLRDERKTYRLC